MTNLRKVDKSERRIMINKKNLASYEPLLDGTSVNAAGFYSEYRTDDSRLTIEVIKNNIKVFVQTDQLRRSFRFNKKRWLNNGCTV